MDKIEQVYIQEERKGGFFFLPFLGNVDSVHFFHAQTNYPILNKQNKGSYIVGYMHRYTRKKAFEKKIETYEKEERKCEFLRWGCEQNLT